MAVIRGPYVRLWFENCAENRKHCRMRERMYEGHAGRGREEGLASLPYYGFPRIIAGYRDLVKWLQNFRFGPSVVAVP